MANLSQLEAYTSELVTSVKALASHCHNFTPSSNFNQPLLPADVPREVQRARESILLTISRLQTLLVSPADFLQELANRNQLLACLQWLGEFQVLACIPLASSVPIKDVADLAGVPENQLERVIRMTATAGFLHEPQPGQVAHSALSAPFVTRPLFLDAAMFLAGTAAPAALQMATTTQRFGASLCPNEAAYNLAFNTPSTFASACEQRPKLQRQWPAFLRYGTGDIEDRVTDLLSQLDQFRCGNISVVEVGARSTERAMALTNLYPTLHFIVQMMPLSTGWTSPIRSNTPCSKHDDICHLSTTSSVDSNNTNNSTIASSTGTNNHPHTPGITVQQRTPATPQSIADAAVYILHLPSPSPTVLSSSLTGRIMAEIRAHFEILRGNPSATLVLAPRLLPEAGMVNPEVEATARLRDMMLLQLANEREMELGELVNILNSVSDSMGRLVVVNKLRDKDSVAIVLEVRYQAYNR